MGTRETPASGMKEGPTAIRFADWILDRQVKSFGTNAGSNVLAFQTWRHFKEAYAPELVAQAVERSPIPVRTCLDPFGGSGTTALAAQFLGVKPVTIEVNPFLADLIEAKLANYDVDLLARRLGAIVRRVSPSGDLGAMRAALPATFVEPGIRGRWLFDSCVADRVLELRSAIDQERDPSVRRFFRIMLSRVLVPVSNVVINGKGRRYRRNWQRRTRGQGEVDDLFVKAATQAIADVRRFSPRATQEYRVIRGDARTTVPKLRNYDLVVFSPPYPNSFDYTDVYNVELWMLGYLTNSQSNRNLRLATLSSHVQVSRNFSSAPKGSPVLDRVLNDLQQKRQSLWDDRIPDMVGAYFGDLAKILGNINNGIAERGQAWIVVGDSSYAGTRIHTALILADLAERLKWTVDGLEPCRSMRASAQQGGREELAETLVVLSKA